MRLLLDTHALIWWMTDDRSLSDSARRAIASHRNSVVVSAASAWEIATKVRLGRLPIASSFCDDMAEDLEQAGFGSLAIGVEHGIRAGTLPGPHKDPFDRMLIAQAQAENLAVVSKDLVFDDYGVRRIW